MKARRHKQLKAVDLFCGAGGTSTGAMAAGVDVVLAVNHWRTAIYSHQENHPGVRHICARIEHIDIRHDATLPDFDLLLASPECTFHSIARGGRPIDDQKRQQPWALLDWIEAKRPKWVNIENVREFRDWGPLVNLGTDGKPRWRPDKTRKGEIFQAWVQAIEALGYQVDWQLLNAADFGAATSRTRLFITARRGRSKKDIPWPEPTHSKAQWRPAHEIIDWSKPCPSIFTRKRPLAEKTLRRIEAGLKKFVGPFVVTLRRNMDARSAEGSLATLTAGAQHHALAVPFQFKAMGRSPGATRSAHEPVPTIVAVRENHAIVTPFLVPHFGERPGQGPRTHAVESPLPAVTGHGAGSLAVPYLLDVNHGGHDHRTHAVGKPLGTVTTTQGQAVCFPFLTKYNSTGGAQSLDQPLDTLTTRDRYGLAMASLVETMRELEVVDIGFRMLAVDELAAAQGFPAGYYLHGTKAEQVKQIGNSVCPAVAEAICRTLAEAA